MRTSLSIIATAIGCLFSVLHAYDVDSDDFSVSMPPIAVSEQIDDPAFDAEIKDAFQSSDFVNKIFNYCLGDKCYKVRIIHNPEEVTFTAVKQFRLEYGDEVKNYSIDWSYKYGILTDVEAPQDLIDHLSQFTNASWWDWYFNFKVCNGTFVEFQKWQSFGQYTRVTTYSLAPWFDYMNDPQR